MTLDEVFGTHTPALVPAATAQPPPTWKPRSRHRRMTVNGFRPGRGTAVHWMHEAGACLRQNQRRAGRYRNRLSRRSALAPGRRAGLGSPGRSARRAGRRAGRARRPDWRRGHCCIKRSRDHQAGNLSSAYARWQPGWARTPPKTHATAAERTRGRRIYGLMIT